MRGKRTAAGGGTRRGFTLVELLIVMTLLTVVLAVALPSLGAFFRGRNLDLEAQRLLALSHLAQSRAVGEGLPVTVWIDAEERTYWVEAAPGWDLDATEPQPFELGSDLEIEVETVRTNRSLQFPSAQGFNTSQAANLSTGERLNLPRIQFQPDGSLSENSVTALVLKDRDGATVRLSQAAYRRGYRLEKARSP